MSAEVEAWLAVLGAVVFGAVLTWVIAALMERRGP
jgi:hypothetical protein